MLGLLQNSFVFVGLIGVSSTCPPLDIPQKFEVSTYEDFLKMQVAAEREEKARKEAEVAAQKAQAEADLQEDIDFAVSKLGNFNNPEASEKYIGELLKVHEANPQSIAGPQIDAEKRRERLQKIGKVLGNSRMGDARLRFGEDAEYKFEQRYKEAMELANALEDQTGESVWDYAFFEAIAGNTRTHFYHVMQMTEHSKGRGLNEIRRMMDEVIRKSEGTPDSELKYSRHLAGTNMRVAIHHLTVYGVKEDVDHLARYSQAAKKLELKEAAVQGAFDSLVLSHRLWAAELALHLKNQDRAASIESLKSLRTRILNGDYRPLEKSVALNPNKIFLESLLRAQSVFGFEGFEIFESSVISNLRSSDDNLGLMLEFLARQEVLKIKANQAPNNQAVKEIDDYHRRYWKVSRKGGRRALTPTMTWNGQAGEMIRELDQLRGLDYDRFTR